RAVRLGEKQTAPRIRDLDALVALTQGEFELETLGEVSETAVFERMLASAVLAVFNRYFAIREFDRLVQAFENGLEVETSHRMPSMDYVLQLSHLNGMTDIVDALGVGGNPGAAASAV